MSTTYSFNGDGIVTSRSPYTVIRLDEGSTDASINNLLFWRPFSGIDALKWGDGIGTGVTLTTSFPTSSQYFYYLTTMDRLPLGPVSGFSAAQQAAAWNAMFAAASVANVSFTPVTESAGGVGDIRWANTGDPTVDTAYTAASPFGRLSEAGDIWFGSSYAQADPSPQGLGMVYMHELGHALGLIHPHHSELPAEPGEDQLKYSIMSYRDFDGDDVGSWDSEFLPTSFMLNDILALQFLYGARTNASWGDETYIWESYDRIYETIWDGGGTDTINAYNQAEAVVLNLNPGAWSQIGVAFFNGQGMVRDCLTIAYGSVIENAVGSAYDDMLIGNDADNRLDGGAGNDTMEGGAGNDTYVINASGDSVIEAAGNGTDTVLSTTSRTLGANIENLTLTGSLAVNGTGNALDNTLAGNSAGNTLDGGDGDDTYSFYVGGGNDQALDSAGADRIVFTGIASTQITASRQGGDIVLRVNVNDSIRFADGGGGYPIEQFEFTDGVKTSSWLDELVASPSGVDKTITTLEDTPYTVTVADFGFTAPNGGTLDSIRFDTAPAAGTLTLNGVDVASGQILAAADIANGTLVFAPAANTFGSGYANATFSVMDQNGVSDSYPNRLTFDVTSVNDVPAGTDKTITFNEDVTRWLTLADFGFTDADVGDTLAAVRIDTLPAVGLLRFNGPVVVTGQVITASDIAASRLWFSSAADANGDNYASFTFSVKDQNGAFDATPNLVTFNVTPVNDLPAGTDKTVTLIEDSSYTVTLADFAFSDADSGDTLNGVRIATLTPAAYFKLNGVTVTANQVIAPADIAAGGLVFTPPANGAGGNYANFTFALQDQNGGFDATPNKLTFNITPVNDAPSGTDKTLTVPEDSGRVVAVADFGFTDVDSSQSGVRIDTLPAVGVLKLNNVGVTAGQILTVAEIGVNSLIWYNTVPNVYGSNYDSFTFSVKDQSTFDPTPNRITIDVTSANDNPTGADTTVTFNEDTSYTVAVADFGFSDADLGDTFASVRIEALPVGSLKLNGIAVTALQTINVADITAGKLVFTPPVNASGNGYTSFTFLVKDQVGWFDTAANRLTFNITPTNDAPNGADKTITIAEDANYAVDASDFGFTDPDAGNSLASVRIETLPAAGTLKLNGATVTAGQVITASDIAAGSLAFAPAANANGAGYSNFTFFVGDASGAFDAASNRLTFNVTSVNDAPASADKALSLNEDTSYTLVAADFAFTDPDASDALNGVRMDTLPGAGALKLNGVNVTAGQVVSYADIAANKLAFTPATHGNGTGYADVTFSVKDNFGAFDPSPNRLTFNVTPANDIPDGTDKTVTINEDFSYLVAVADFGFTDPDAGDTLSAVRIDARPTTGTFKLNGSNLSNGQVVTVADIAAGKLVFTPATNASGSNYASFTFSVKDSSGTFDAAPNRLTFNVSAVNDVPTGSVAINGAPNPGQTLTAVSTLADPDGLGALSYQWLRGTTPIAGATATSYTLVSADIGSTVSVRVSYVDAGGTAESSTSTPTSTVNVPPNGTGNVTITGNAAQYQTLTAVTTQLADPNGLGTLNYQWFHGGVAVTGATAKTYTLAQTDVGMRMSVQVSYIDGSGVPESKTSSQTSNVSNLNDLPAGTINIVGSGGPGAVLFGDTSGLSDLDGLGTFSFQWLRGGSQISGATAASYTLQSADEGAGLSLRVKYTDALGKNETVISDVLNVGKTITGTSAADTLAGTVGADSINAGAGNDVITGGRGNDAIVGDSGIDVLSINGPRSSTAVVIHDFSILTATVQSAGSPGDGMDSTTGVERIVFTDTALAIDLNGSAGMTARVVGALLGPSYVQNRDVMGSVLDQADTGLTQVQLAAYVAGTDLFASLAGSHSNVDFVRHVFEMIYLRSPNSEELSMYVDMLNNGVYTQGSLGSAAADTGENLMNIDFTGLQGAGFSYTF